VRSNMEVLGAVSAGFGLFNNCLHAYRLVSEAIEVHDEASKWDVLMRIERTRFEVWGRTVGFLDEKTGDEQESPESTVGMMKLDVSLQADAIRTLVIDIMKSICKTLQDFEGTKQQYSLGPKPGASTATQPGTTKSKVGKLLKSTQTFSRHLKLVILDKGKVKELLNTLLLFNNGLENLLSLPQKIQAAKALASGVLSSYQTSKKLDVVLATQTSAQNTVFSATTEVKRQCLELHSGDDLFDASDSLSTTVKSQRLDLDCLVLERVPRKAAKDVLWPHTSVSWKPSDNSSQQRVLVEWRSRRPVSPGFVIPEDQLELRWNMLVQLLHDTATKPQAEGYLTLDCLGYLETTGRSDGEEQDIVGFVSRFPEWAEQSRDPVSLYQLLSRAFTADSPGSVPSLGQRFMIAQRVSTALYQLQCSQWLHRNLCSNHIVFFHDKATGELRLDEPRLIGLQYSRPDDQNARDGRKAQISEGFSDFGSLEPYMHPKVKSRSSRFRRSYDIYSLGIILFEIAFWEPAEEYSRPDGPRVMETTKVELAAEVGERYSEAVLACLTGFRGAESLEAEDDETPYDGSYNGEDPEFGLESDLLWKVVRQIEKCVV